MFTSRNSKIGRLGLSLTVLLAVRGSYVIADGLDRAYTGVYAPTRYNVVDPYVVLTLVAQLNHEFSEGKITYAQFEQAHTQLQHGVKPVAMAKKPILNDNSLPIIPKKFSSGAGSGSQAAGSCDGTLDCGACFFKPSTGYDHSKCVPGDTSEFMGCKYEECGYVPKGYACGTSQSGPTGYAWTCQPGLICAPTRESLLDTNYIGVCVAAGTGVYGVKNGTLMLGTGVGVVGDGVIGGGGSEKNAIAAQYFTGNYKWVNGFEMTNLMDPKMQSPKYVFLRTVQDMGLFGKAESMRWHLQAVVDVLKERGFPDAKVMGHDKIWFGDEVGIIDVITAEGEWWWGWGTSSEMEGFDQNKLNDLSVRTAKYMFGRLIQHLALDAPSHRGNLQPLVDELLRRRLFLQAKVVDVDKIDFGGDVGVIDVINANGHWWWGPQSK